MKKILFLIAFTMTCKEVTEGWVPAIYRCENDEVVCYVKPGRDAGLFCIKKERGEL